MSTVEPFMAGALSREEVARRDLERTGGLPATLRAIVGCFSLLIGIVPAVELWAARTRSANEGGSAWSHLMQVATDIRVQPSPPVPAADPGSMWQRLLSANRIVLAGFDRFERTLEDESLIGRALRPRAQTVMTGWLGAGNERVYPGRDRWLFYRPDVEYITSPGFLDAAQIERRIVAAPEWTAPPQPDPRPAIAQLKRDLDARGIALIVMPTPVKPAVHPEMLAKRYVPPGAAIQNPSHDALIADLRRGGVVVFDPSAALAAARRAGPQFLATDTHWRPEAMEEVATALGELITREVRLPASPDPGYTVTRLEVRNVGDTARMLDLPDDSTLFNSEVVWLRRILQPGRSLWRPSRDASVLLLGDSFSNIYSLESMGWGTSAGFAEQLSYSLGMAIDRLLQNDQGAFATRALLQREPERLNGKRVVIYQFAARELIDGDWTVLPLPPP